MTEPKIIAFNKQLQKERYELKILESQIIDKKYLIKKLKIKINNLKRNLPTPVNNLDRENRIRIIKKSLPIALYANITTGDLYKKAFTNSYKSSLKTFTRDIKFMSEKNMIQTKLVNLHIGRTTLISKAINRADHEVVRQIIAKD